MRSGFTKARLATAAAVLLLAWNFWVIRMMAGTFATGLAWWANVLLVIGLPVAVGAAWLSRRGKEGPWLVLTNGLIAALYIVFWSVALWSTLQPHHRGEEVIEFKKSDRAP